MGDKRAETNIQGEIRPKLKTKFVVALWGERYIKEFQEIALPAHLAPGNLPYLNRETDLEICFLTDSKSQELFDRSPFFEELHSLYSIRFLPIDDVIQEDFYGITLTVAFARAVMAAGEDQTQTYFIFMNADFILSDNSMVAVLAQIREGCQCIFAPSLRARAEDAIPQLAALRRNEQHVLQLQARDLVKIALENIHPTVTAKMVTQEFVHCQTYNQMYWRIDESTLLARHFLAFPLVVRPEVPLDRVVSYFDYGFVPEVFPSREFTMISDSDEFCMIELQPTAQENEFLRLGPLNLDDVARDLSVWTTYEHRLCAKFEAVFHSGDMPEQLEACKQDARRLMERLQLRMTRFPIDHRAHPYWCFPLKHFADRRREEAVKYPLLPKEVSSYEEVANLTHYLHLREDLKTWSSHVPSNGMGWYRYLQILRRKASALFRYSIFSQNFLELQLAQSALRQIKKQSADGLLLIADLGSYPDRILSNKLEVELVSINDVLENRVNSINFAHVFIHFRNRNPSLLVELLEELRSSIQPSVTIWILVEQDSNANNTGLSSSVTLQISRMLSSAWSSFDISAKFVGDEKRAALRLSEHEFRHRVFEVAQGKSRTLRAAYTIFWNLASWFIVRLRIAGDNLFALLKETAPRGWRGATNTQPSLAPSCCSSVLLTLSHSQNPS